MCSARIFLKKVVGKAKYHEDFYIYLSYFTNIIEKNMEKNKGYVERNVEKYLNNNTEM